MKLFEIIVRPDRITIRRESEESLSGDQKQTIILVAIACIAFLGFLGFLASAS